MKIAIIDINEHARNDYAGMVDSVIGGWLEWEVSQQKLSLVDPQRADIIFLVHSGSINYVRKARGAFKKYGVDPTRQYIITGGAVANNPFIAFEYAHALAVGEAYKFVRSLLKKIKAGKRLKHIREWIQGYKYAIECQQIRKYGFDEDAPWLLTKQAEPLAEPDPWVDWGNYPPVRSSDNVVRLIGSKGCHRKCTFCATTYNQTYRVNEEGQKLVTQMKRLQAQGERVQIISNDPANLPFFDKITGKMDSQSFTIDEMADDGNRRTIIQAGVGIARFGVEGVSERIRKAFGKPISNKKLYKILGDFHSAGINTHLFYIVGAPYEVEKDWAEFKTFIQGLSDILQSGVCRIKLTTFMPTPPAPLARFIPGMQYEAMMNDFVDWRYNNYANPHVLLIKGRKRKSHLRDVREQLTLTKEQVQTLLEDTDCYDLTPSLEDWKRLPWEIIDWPIAQEKRYRISEVYKKKMQPETQAS